ncbi:hypothetical protein CDD82_1759 [Ophiocordyceps australis]|uniref:Uncharacterized protein n=1 Tax=Ophiocordyceps australis TaxID=1399860 RepID=A0A2C5YAE6_9HYPO|nr:hypothetical protein CDD82_1759 [Ophiocordyceps australis]
MLTLTHAKHHTFALADMTLQRNPSAPALIQHYSHKPLPPLPNSSPSSRLTMAKMPMPSPTAAPSRLSSPASGRRSSRKIHQLTGFDVGSVPDEAGSRGSTASNSSSYYSQMWDADPDFVPSLETDSDASSRYSTSSSPPPDLKPVALWPHPLKLGDKRWTASPQQSPREWNPAHGHFSDSKTAGEYHRIATELASRLTIGTCKDAPSQQAREQRPASDTSHPATARPCSYNTPLALDAVDAAAWQAPRPAPAIPGPRSGFDYSSSSDSDGPNHVWAWLRRKSHGQLRSPRPKRRPARHCHHVRQLLHQARGGWARHAAADESEMRRQELRRQIRRLD